MVTQGRMQSGVIIDVEAPWLADQLDRQVTCAERGYHVEALAVSGTIYTYKGDQV